MSSIPTLNRIKESLRPTFSLSSLGMLAWVMVAGWPQSDSTPPSDSARINNLNLSRITEEEDSNIKNEDRKKCYIRENVKFYQKLKSPFLKTSAEAFEAGNFPKLLSSLRTIFI